MGDVVSHCYFTYICGVKEEIYKINYEKYYCTKYKDRSSIVPLNDEDKDYLFGIEPTTYGATSKHPSFQVEESYTGKEKYNEYLTNPMYSVSKKYVMALVEKNDDKVSMKIFQGVSHRGEGKGWFRVSKNVDYITVNIKTGDVYHGYLHGYEKKKKSTKSIRRNSFFSQPIETVKSQLKNILTWFTDDAYEEVSMAVSEFMFLIDKRKNFEKLSSDERLLRFYFDKKGIKYPNNFKIFATELLGREIKKILKKNDNKLVDSVMQKHGLYGKKIKKALHQCDRLNISLYQNARNVFGDDWLNQDDENIIIELLNSIGGAFNVPSSFNELVTKEELKRVYSLFKQSYIYENLDSFTFMDHIRMYTELKTFGENDLKWYSVDDNSDFRKEHLDWTDKLQHYKKGTYVRTYPDYMYETISQPLYVDFHPVLLDSTQKYNDESKQQSNCVKGYIGKSSSIIISVRTGQSLTERATVEYLLTKESDKVSAKRVQSLGKFNQKLEDEWNEVLLKLDQVVLSCVRDERFETVKLTKECKNGVVLSSDSYWDEDGKLRWTYKNIDNNHSLFMNEI